MVLTFVRQTDLYTYEKIVGLLLYTPILILGPTDLNLAAFDYTNCWRLAQEGQLLLYVYFIELVLVVWMVLAAFWHIRKNKDPKHRKVATALTIGGAAFLLSFASGNIFGTLLQDVMGESAWQIGQYGMLGMPLFLGIIVYLFVQYELFKVRLLYAEGLTLILGILIVSLVFITDPATARPVTVLTIIMYIVLAYFLIRGVRRDIKQKEEIERLMEGLARANKRLKAVDKQKSEFVSIASHQLRSPLTVIRGYASMLLEGSFGKLPSKAKEPLEHVEDSARMMALSIEDYLNVSRIESGNMKYEYTDFNLPEIVQHICDDLRQEAVKRGLLLLHKTDLNTKGVVHADHGKIEQIIHNLINNALKYTPKGSVTVYVYDEPKKGNIHVEVIDTGIGMTKETQDNIFQKFQRATNAHSVNVHGTGLGLFVAKRMANAMNGDITTWSKGEEKGSHFVLTLPLQL
jgi:signal transduction histidine kinase